MTPKYVGDLSRQDAAVLTACAKVAGSIVECGAGASTMILAQAAPPDARIVTIEPDPVWITKTRLSLMLLGVIGRVSFNQPIIGPIDLAFNDGPDATRRSFARDVWPHLRTGGRLLFHDTRRPGDIGLMIDHLRDVALSVVSVLINVDDSNITVITKGPRRPYVDWNDVEGRPRWAIVNEGVPDSFWRQA